MGDVEALRDVLAIPEDDGLLFACVLDGEGSATLGGWNELAGWRENGVHHWVHLDRNSETAQRWIREESGLTEITAEAMLSDEDRPRTFFGKRGTIVIARGANTNPGAEPEDLVAMRMWCDGVRLITVREQRLLTPRDVLAELLHDGVGPKTASNLFERLLTRLTQRMATVVERYETALDDIEAQLNEIEPGDARAQVQDARADVVVLRRYMAPQKEALSLLHSEPPDWLEEISRLLLRETINRLLDLVEDLEAARERAIVIDDAIAARQAERMNKNMYVLSIVAAIFLPLGFITGLFGINVGGMPGVENPYGFWLTCAAVVALLGVELVLFRMLKWI